MNHRTIGLIAACVFLTLSWMSPSNVYADANDDLVAGHAALLEGAPDKALPLLKSAAESLPTSVEAQLALGRCHLQLGQVSEAASQLRNVLKLSPNHQEATKLLNALAGGQRGFAQGMATAKRLAGIPAYPQAIGVLADLLRRPLEKDQLSSGNLLLAEYLLLSGQNSSAMKDAVALIESSTDPNITGPAKVIAALAVSQIANAGPTEAATALRFIEQAGELKAPWKERADLVRLMISLIPTGEGVTAKQVAVFSSKLASPLSSIPPSPFRQSLVSRYSAACHHVAQAAIARGDTETASAIIWPMVSDQPAPGAPSILKPVELKGGWLGRDGASLAGWVQVENALRSIGASNVTRLGSKAQLVSMWLAAETIRQSPDGPDGKATRTISLVGLLAGLSHPPVDRKVGTTLSHADRIQYSLILTALKNPGNEKQCGHLVGAIINHLKRYSAAGDADSGLNLFKQPIQTGFETIPIGISHNRILSNLAAIYGHRGKAEFDRAAATLQANANAQVNTDDLIALDLHGRMAATYSVGAAPLKEVDAISARYVAAEKWQAAQQAIATYHTALAAAAGDQNAGKGKSARRWALLRLQLAHVISDESKLLASRRKLPAKLSASVKGALSEAVSILNDMPTKSHRLAVIGVAQSLVKRYANLQRLDLAEATIATVLEAQGQGKVEAHPDLADLNDWAIWTRIDLLENQATVALARQVRELNGGKLSLDTRHLAELKLLGELIKKFPTSPYAVAAANRVTGIASTYQRFGAHEVATKTLTDFIASHPKIRPIERLEFNVAQIALAHARVTFSEGRDATSVPDALSKEHAAAIDAVIAFLKKYPSGSYAASAENELLKIARTYGSADAWPVVRQVLTRLVASIPDLREPRSFKLLEAATFLGELDREHGVSLFQSAEATSTPNPQEHREAAAMATQLALGKLDKDLVDLESSFLNQQDPAEFAARPDDSKPNASKPIPNPAVTPPASDTALAMVRRSEQRQLAALARLRSTAVPGNRPNLAQQNGPGAGQAAGAAGLLLPDGVVLSEAAVKKQDIAADHAYVILLSLLKTDKESEHIIADRARQQIFWMIGFFEGQLRHDHAIVLTKRYLKDQPTDPDRVALAFRIVSDEFTFATSRKPTDRINQAWVDERHKRFEIARLTVAAFIKENADHLDWINKARVSLFNSYLQEAELVVAVSHVRAGGLLVRAADELLKLLREVPSHPDTANHPATMWAIADRLTALGQRDQAIYILNRITVHFPTHALSKQALLRVAQTYAADLASPLRAVETYQEYLSLVGDDQSLRQQIFNIASTLAGRRRYIEALHVYEVFVDSFPSDPQADAALQAIGGIHQANEIWEDAIAAYQRVIDEFPSSKRLPQVKFAVAECQINLGEWRTARGLYEDFVRSYPKDPQSALANSRIGVLKNLSRYRKLLDDDEVKRNKDDAQFQTARIVLEQLKYPRKAIREFQKVTANYPKSHMADDAQFEIGKIYLSLNELDTAREELLKVAVNHPSSSLADNALYLIGQSFEQQAARFVSVTATAVRAQAFERGQKLAYLTAQADQQNEKQKNTTLQRQLKQEGKTREIDLNEALSNSSSGGRRRSNIYNQSASVVLQAEAESALEIANRQDKINEAFRRAASMYARAAREYPLGDQTSESLLRMAAIHETKLKDREAAKLTYERIVKVFPGTPVAENAAWKVAQFHEQEGKYDLAVVAYRDFIRNYPASGRVADAQFAMAESLEQLGRWVEAMDAYQTFRDKFVKHTNSAQALEQINWIKAYRR